MQGQCSETKDTGEGEAAAPLSHSSASPDHSLLNIPLGMQALEKVEATRSRCRKIQLMFFIASMLNLLVHSLVRPCKARGLRENISRVSFLKDNGTEQKNI